MINKKRIIAIIPARAGSKGIIDKNIKKLKDKPLIAHTIEQALASKYIDKVIVSTDSSIIANVSVENGAEVPFLRPKELASDESKTIECIVYTLNRLKTIEHYDYVVLLQPTQPLRRAFHIDHAIEQIVYSNASSLLSVSEVKEHPILMRKIMLDNKLKSLFNVNSTVRRQDFEKIYKVNGAIYINKIDDKFNLNTSFNDNEIAYLMDRKYDIDIDELIDFEVAEIKLNKLNE